MVVRSIFREREMEEEETEHFHHVDDLVKKGPFPIRNCGFGKGFPSSARVRILMGSKSDSIIDSSGEQPQDADYYYLPSLSYELETRILARVPRSEYWKLSFVNKRFLALVKSGEIFKVRSEIGVKEASVFMLPIGERNWRAFDRNFMYPRRLPTLPSDSCFENLDKESFCAGTHLIVSGKDMSGAVVWRYELAANKWFKGPSMIRPRCLFASASCGGYAFVAGGLESKMEAGTEILNSAERYNPESKSWELLPWMWKRRKLCSGAILDGKFYVIGGQDEHNNNLSCAEFFNEKTNTWKLVPDMFKGIPVATCQSPPLVAVANNQLYSLDPSSNELRLYLKESNSWKKLGAVPVRADVSKGWGVAFKSLGNELFVIGASSTSFGYGGHGMTIYTCCPDPAAEKMEWRHIKCCTNQRNNFILNCSIMVA